MTVYEIEKFLLTYKMMKASEVADEYPAVRHPVEVKRHESHFASLSSMLRRTLLIMASRN